MDGLRPVRYLVRRTICSRPCTIQVHDILPTSTCSDFSDVMKVPRVRPFPLCTSSASSHGELLLLSGGKPTDRDRAKWRELSNRHGTIDQSTLGGTEPIPLGAFGPSQPQSNQDQPGSARISPDQPHLALHGLPVWRDGSVLVDRRGFFLLGAPLVGRGSTQHGYTPSM
jgi:hypothetical protein